MINGAMIYGTEIDRLVTADHTYFCETWIE